MQKYLFTIIAIIFAGITSAQDVGTEYGISNRIHIMPLDDEDGAFLNDLFDDVRGDYLFGGKKVAFDYSGWIVGKEDYFEMHKKSRKGENVPCQRGDLLIFDERQKEESGGYDAVILYWFKILPRISIIVESLRKDLLESDCYVSRKYTYFCDIPDNLIYNIDNMGVDDLSPISTSEAAYLNCIFDIDVKDYDLNGKNIYFQGGKKRFFDKEKSAFKRNRTHLPGHVVIYFFNDLQKEQCQGYDAAIINYSSCKNKIPSNKQVLKIIRPSVGHH